MGLGMNNDMSEEAQRRLADDEQVAPPIAVGILRLRRSHGRSSVCEGFFERTVKMKKRDKEREDTNAV